MKRFALMAAALIVFLSHFILAAVPQLINFQGILKDGSGNPVANGSYSVVFTIYDAATGGTNLWTETQSVTTSSGLFTILLGSTNPVPDSAFSNSNRYLGIKVGADPEMTPRQQLVSLSYAFRVNSVDGALGGTITSKLSIGPGHSNSGANAFVTGANNTVTGDSSTVAGGTRNTVSGKNSAVDGGFGNIASNDYAVVAGGIQDTASGINATSAGAGLTAPAGRVQP